jgi:predicted Zn-ribbon and HTH transcriptional regulator
MNMMMKCKWCGHVWGASDDRKDKDMVNCPKCKTPNMVIRQRWMRAI